MGASYELQVAIAAAINDAAQRKHRTVGLEHLLVFILSTGRDAGMIAACGGNVAAMRQELGAFLGSIGPVKEIGQESKTVLPQQTDHMRRVLSECQTSRTIKPSDAIEFMFVHAPDSWATRLLARHGVVYEKVVTWNSNNGGSPKPATPKDDEEEDMPISDAIGKFTTDMREQALAGRYDPLVGREGELDRIIHILARRKKNNPVLVGDPGVGKTAIAEGLARRINAVKVPPFLRGVAMRSLDVGALIAGTRYRGEFEARVCALLNEAKAMRGRLILFIDEMHMLLGAGAASGGSVDAANLLKPALASGDLRCIGATTHDEYRKYVEKDAALARRFQSVAIEEPKLEDSVKILGGLVDGYAAHHDVSYDKEAISRAAVLSDRHIKDMKLPGKAVDVLDEVGATVHLSGRWRVTVADVEATVAAMARVPVDTLSGAKRAQDLRGDLRKVIFGQDEAVDRVSAAVQASLAGLAPQERPIGSFLLDGPTGVGKTELARQLAALLGMRLVRLDMSEYMERHTVSRLVGAPPGYVGFEQNGLLVNAIKESPHAVVLLDEVEKAHPDIFNILLQVMDYGSMTDGSGRQADFRHAILLMTTNVGAGEKARRLPGFGGKVEEPKGESYLRTFSPEFRNRLDGIVRFKPLSQDTMLMIADKFLGRLSSQLGEKGLSLSVSDKARGWLAERGYDPAFGARPMERLVRERIAQPLAAMILEGRQFPNGKVAVGIEGGELFVGRRKPSRKRVPKEEQCF